MSNLFKSSKKAPAFAGSEQYTGIDPNASRNDNSMRGINNPNAPRGRLKRKAGPKRTPLGPAE
jgi:hypothetical protein